MGDLHIPYHNAALVNRCMLAAKKAGVTKLILAGDALDMRAFSHWPDDFTDSDRLMASKNVTSELLKIAGGLDAETAEKIYHWPIKSAPKAGTLAKR